MLGNVLIGRKLGDYMIVEMLGQGGMAHVYKGYDANLDRHAAVKVIAQNTVASEDEKEYRERFQREARSIARLSHPRIVSVYQFGQTEDHLYYMAMKFVDGHDLRQILKEYVKRGRQMSHRNILQIIRDIADALDYAHLQGVIHRDVKPSNIMVTQDGHAVLTDFGLALSATEGTIGNTFGSVHYIAPEQAVSSKQASPQSDLYSLGVVLYEMLTGRVPFDDASAMSVALKHISDPPPPPSQINPDISPQVEEVLMKMLDKDPRRRYLTGAAFVYALEVAMTLDKDQDTEQLDDSRSKPIRPVVQSTVPPPKAATTPAVQPAPKPVATLADIQEAETVTDSSSSSQIRRDIEKAQSHTRNTLATRERRQTAFIVGAVVIALMIASFGLIVSLMNNPIAAVAPTENPTSTTTPLAIAQIGTEEITPSPTITPTATPTTAFTVTSTPKPETTSTPTPLPPTATDTLEPSPTVEPTAGLIAASGEAQILLRYDGRTLIIYNRSANNRINISDLEFTRKNANGSELSFNSNQLGSGNDNLYALRAKDCFQIWSPDFTFFATNEFPADICRYRQGFVQTNDVFWTSDIEGQTFEIRRENTVLATCPAVPKENTSDNRCAVAVP